MNGLTPYTIIPQTYWNPYAGQIPYVQQPTVAYYQPYDYQMQYPVVLAAPPTLVSQTPVIQQPGPLLYAPLGPTRQESNIVYTSLGIAPRPIAPAPYPQAVIPTPIMSPVLLSSQRINHQRSSRASPQNHPGRSSLPLISRREIRHERDQDRHSHDDRLIMSYFGRRRDVDRHRYPDRWYY